MSELPDYNGLSTYFHWDIYFPNTLSKRVQVPEDWVTGTVRANGIDVQYYQVGDGPPLVLAHGLFDNGRCWAPVVAELKTDFTVTMYDARGHGGTDAPETGYGIEDRATDLLGVLDALSITKPVVLGHSLGGSTAAWAAAKNPGTLRGIILLDPAGIHGEPDIGPDERAEMVRDRVERHAEQSLSELIQEYDEWDPELARRLAVADKECSPHIAKITARGFPRLNKTFEDIDCPTLVLRSDGSPTERADDLEVADNLQNGRLVHIHEAGHCIHRDCYDAAMAEIKTFLYRYR